MSKLRKNFVRAGLTISSLLIGAAAFAQDAATTTTVTPGVPTTAYGGYWISNLILLAVGVAFALIGLVMYRREKSNENV